MRLRRRNNPHDDRHGAGSQRPARSTQSTRSTAAAKTTSLMEDVEVLGVAWSDFDQVDDLTRSMPFTDRVCACNAKPSGILCTCNNPCCKQEFRNTPERQCLGLFFSLLLVLAVCSVVPTLLAIVPSVAVAHFGTVHTASAAGGSSVVDSSSTFLQYLLLGASAHLLALVSRLPWLSFKRSVYARAVVVLRTVLLPRAVATLGCSVIASIVLFYLYARASGIGGGLAAGVRGGGGDHVWGQLLFVCPAWGERSVDDGMGMVDDGMVDDRLHHTCVNNVQFLSFVAAVTAGWLHAFLYIHQEQYILYFPIVHRRRLTQLCPRLAAEAIRGPVLALLSTLAAYVVSDVALSREFKHTLVTTCLTWLYGGGSGTTGGVRGTGGLLDTTDPHLAYLQSNLVLEGVFMCWSISVWVWVTLSMSNHILMVLLTHAIHSNVANNLMTWSTWLVSPSVRGRYRVGTQGRWDSKLVTKSMQRSTTVVMNEMRRRQERATRRFGTHVDVKTAITTDGEGPLQFTPKPYTLNCVLVPLGEWGDEDEDRNDDGIEALLMSLSIAKPGSLHEKFLRWVPPSRRYVYVNDSQTGDSLFHSHYHSEEGGPRRRGSGGSGGGGGGLGGGSNSRSSRSRNSNSSRSSNSRSSNSSSNNNSNSSSGRNERNNQHTPQYAVGDSLRGGGLADHHGGIENTRMRDFDGIRSTVPPHRVLQMIGERRFYEVLQHHANEMGEDDHNFDYFDEVKQMAGDTGGGSKSSKRPLQLKEEIARTVALLHMKSVANHDASKLKRLFNAQHGDAWIEVVRLCTAKIDALTLSLQLMSTLNVAVKPGWEGKIVEPLDLGVAPNPLMSRLRPNTARVHEWKKRSTNRSRRRWKLSWLPQWTRKWLWWFHEWYEISPSHASQRLHDQMSNSHHNLAQWTLQGIDPSGQAMFPWTDWPRSASEQLEQAYVREHTRVTVQVYSRDIWSGYNVWARTRASTLDDSDDENDLTNPEEVLTLIIDLETDNGTEYYEAVSMVNANGKGGGPCHTFRVKRTCRGLNGELLRGNIMKSAKELGQTMTTEENAEDITSDRFGLIYGSVCFRSPQEETKALFSEIQTDILVIEAMTNSACRASKLNNIHQTAILNTIPTILCSLVANLIAIREYEKSPSYLGQNGQAPELGTHLLSRPHPKALSFILERSIYNIVINYYNHIRRFEFPKEYQQILQSFADFTHP